MNKKRLIIVLLGFSLSCQAQDELDFKLRHVKGIKALDFDGGMGADNSWNVEIALTKFLSGSCFFKTGFNFEKTPFPSVTLTDYCLRPSVNYTIFKLGTNIYFNGEAGLFTGFENNTAFNPSDDVTYVYPAASHFIYGYFAGGNLEIYMNGNAALISSIEQLYLIGSAFGDLKYQLKAGFRFVLD
jgi:hypothetical protein